MSLLDDELDAVRAVIADLDRIAPEAVAASARRSFYLPPLYQAFLARFGPPDMRKLVANDVVRMCALLHELIAARVERGAIMPPYVAMRIAVNLRRHKHFALERDLCRSLMTKFPDLPGADFFTKREAFLARKL